jgi:transposase-like protein
MERVNEEFQRRTRVVGIFPNAAVITRAIPDLDDIPARGLAAAAREWKEHPSSPHSRDRTQDLTSQSHRFIVAA